MDNAASSSGSVESSLQSPAHIVGDAVTPCTETRDLENRAVGHG